MRHHQRQNRKHQEWRDDSKREITLASCTLIMSKEHHAGRPQSEHCSVGEPSIRMNYGVYEFMYRNGCNIHRDETGAVQ